MPITAETYQRIDLLRDIAARSGLTRFVETGSDIGNICDGLVNHFDQLWTVELDHDSYRACVRRFLHEPKVMPIHGDSAQVLQEICPQIGPAVWFLDAHYNEGHTRGPVDCPLLDELTHIVHTTPYGHWIVIDDAQLVGLDPAYPTVDQIVVAVDPHGSRRGPAYDFDFGPEQIIVRPISPSS